MHTIAEFREWRRGVPAGVVLPFVPTMGALHAGHGSLVRAARTMAGGGGKVMASIFVNPTQFGHSEDFTKYPRTLEADVKMLAAAGCDAVLVPSAEEMYGGGSQKSEDRSQKSEVRSHREVMVDPGAMGDILEGAIRPGHFRGVCTVVLKLLNIVTPTHLLLGQKDFQQQAILRRMRVDLNVGTEVVTCPTHREPDGLAMSSRNRYLSPEERPRAVGLFEGMSWAKEAFARGERKTEVLERGMRECIEAKGLEVQYAVVREPLTLEPWPGEIGGTCVLLVAAKLGATRLIDNMVLGWPAH